MFTDNPRSRHIEGMKRFILALTLLSSLSSDDNSVAISGVVGTRRTIVCSENTLSSDITSAIDTSGSSEELIGSIEINLFNNNTSESGKVQLANTEYANSKFRVLKVTDDDVQVKISIKASKETDGTASDPYRTLTPAAEVLLRDPTTTVVDEKIVLEFYAVDDADNSTSDGAYTGNFLVFWEDD